jgi:hypothetical protein
MKHLVSKIDFYLFNSSIRKAYKNWQDKTLYKHRSEFFRYGHTGEYIKNNHSTINILCDKYGSDKGEVSSENNPYYWASHNYADIYDLLFRLRRNDVQLVLECGLGTNNPDLISSMEINGKPGASLRLWRDYFPKAQIIGIDIDSDILFSDDRIETYQCDQTSSESIENFCKLASLSAASVDIIIDDGLHEFHAGKSLFESMNKYLTKDGMYIIEDVIPNDYRLYKDYFAKTRDKFTIQIFNLHRPNLPVRDNRLIIIRHVD